MDFIQNKYNPSKAKVLLTKNVVFERRSLMSSASLLFAIDIAQRVSIKEDLSIRQQQLAVFWKITANCYSYYWSKVIVVNL